MRAGGAGLTVGMDGKPPVQKRDGSVVAGRSACCVSRGLESPGVGIQQGALVVVSKELGRGLA